MLLSLFLNIIQIFPVCQQASPSCLFFRGILPFLLHALINRNSLAFLKDYEDILIIP